MLESNTMRVLQIGDPSVGVLREEHLHHRSSCLGAGVLWQQDSTAIAIRREADGGTKLPIEDHGVELACNQVLVDSALTAAYTPHGFAYDVLHRTHAAKIRARSEHTRQKSGRVRNSTSVHERP